MNSQFVRSSLLSKTCFLPTVSKMEETAAEWIRQADILLVATGAGFSADSGLPVYKDIANHPAYKDRSLTYEELCCDNYLNSDPELFYGFFGSTINQYRSTPPHLGYHIIKRWRDAYFSNKPENELHNQFRTLLQQKLDAVVEETTSER
jgi:hypothetical protein